MPKEFSRNERISSQIQKELAALLMRGIKDPRLGFVTINAVEVTRDLSVAKVYMTVLGADEDEIHKNVKILNQAGSFIRHELGKNIRMRSIPELRFVYDDSIDRGMKLDSLLDEISREDAARHED
ncbi:MAG: 30S ribosome-binding factor RbfA [Pseudomonadota bacterium]